MLFVDDEPHVVDLLCRTFEGSYDCLAAASGEEGLAILADREVDLLVTDQKMPGMTGVELIERAREAQPELTAILLTGYADPRDIIDAINKGHVFRYVTKPWDLTDLIMTVRNALDHNQLRKDNRVLLDELRKRVSALSVLYEVARETAESPTPGQVVQRVLTRFGDIVPFDLAAALLADGPGRGPTLDIFCRAPVGERNLLDAKEAALELFRAAAGQPILEAELQVRVTGASAGEALARRPLKSHLQVPLTVAGRPAGAVALFSFREGAFRSEDEQLLDTLANQTAEAIRRLEGRLGEERRRLAQMVEAMADGVIYADPKGDVVVANRAAREMLGLDPVGMPTARELQEQLGFYPFELVRGMASREGRTLTEDLRIGERHLQSVVSAVADAEGAVAGVVVVLRDVTEQKRLEERKEEFVSIISHELRTPLTSISGALDLVLNHFAGPVSEKQQRYLAMAKDSTEKLNAIVDDLLDLSKFDKGKLRMTFEVAFLDELARQAVERYQPAALDRGITLEGRYPDGPLRVLVDPGRIAQVLNNLLTNSLKFTPEGGRIELSVFRCASIPGFAGVSCWNSGEAIPEPDLERIFDRFEQARSEKTRAIRGTGLGLAICRSILGGHGGQIWAEPGPGARFVCTLPLEPSAAEPARPAERPLVAGERPPCVLGVDDEREHRALRKGLRIGRGYRAVAAASAEEALALARAKRPELICIDVRMPGVDGLRLAEILRHDPETRSAPLLVLSAADEREASFRAGAQAFLPKPLDTGRFAEAVDTLVAARRQARTGGAKVLVVDDDPSIRAIAVEILSGLGYRVLEAGDRKQALLLAREQRPELLLLDVMLPDGDGFGILEEIKADRLAGPVSAIFVSARGPTQDKVRALRLGADDYVVKPFDAIELGARVETVLRRREQELSASPTTRLPGGISIEREVQRRLDSREPFTLVYLDLDNLKAYNDHYGYAKADGVIQQTGDLLRQILGAHGSPGDFLGHIAGDDFVIVADPARADLVCAKAVEAFDRVIPLYYDKDDRERGFIEAADRFGVRRQFPIMSISVASVVASAGRFADAADLSRAATEVKAKAKAVPGSVHVKGEEPAVKAAG